MTSRLTVPAAQSALIAAAALLGATLVGLAIAVDVPKGIALATGICYAPLVLINLPLGLCLWIVLVFIEAFPIVSVGPTAAAILIALSWLGTLRTRREAITGVLVRHRILISALVLFLVWLTLSASWARDPGQVFDQLTYHYAAAITFVIVATTLTRPDHLRLAVAAFVIGGVLSVLAGFVVNGISTGGSAASLASEGDSRFGGGSGDPNFLGAGLVPAIVLAGAMFRQVRDPIARWMLAVAMVILSIGLAASQSRGGLLAAVVALVAALVLYRRKLPILAFLGLVVAFLWIWFAANPQTWDRIRTFDDGGSGRQDLWAVGWRIFEDKPVNGVGLNNFRQESFRYVREPGKLERVDLVAERPRIVHNVYLQIAGRDRGGRARAVLDRGARLPPSHVVGRPQVRQSG